MEEGGLFSSHIIILDVKQIFVPPTKRNGWLGVAL